MAIPPPPRGSGALDFRMLQAAMSEAHLVVHGPPDFPANAQVLGVCGVSEQNAELGKYSWIVDDFLQWKTLFYGVGFKSAQTWLSSLELPDTIHGDNIDTGMFNSNVNKPANLPNDNEAFVTAFLERIVESARAALVKKTALVVLVFAPVTPEQDICVDFGGEKLSITAERLCETVKLAVGDVQLPVVLVTPSPFTGGWLCRPSLMGWPVSPNPDTTMRIIAKSCGGAFASRFISTFTESQSPLLTMAQRQKIKYDDPMPLHPTQLQTDCLHYLQRKIHESLEHHFSPLAKSHSFVLTPDAPGNPSAVSDTWADYSPRKGRTVNFWANRWGPTRPAIDDPDRFEFLGEAFGATRESQIFHLKYLAALELETCPGDWERRVGGITRELLTNFVAKLAPSEEDAKRIFDTIKFRSSCMVLAQIIAKAFALPLPDGLKCRYWHDKMDGVSDDYYRKLQYAFGDAHNLFDQAPMLPGERRHDFKNVRFLRAARWLSAAIALKFKDGTRQDIEKFVQNDVSKLITSIRDTQRKLLLESRAVTEASLNWIAVLGLGGGVRITPEITAAFAAMHAQKEATETALFGKGATASPAALNPKATPWHVTEVPPAHGETQAWGAGQATPSEMKTVEDEAVSKASTHAEIVFNGEYMVNVEDIVERAPKDAPFEAEDWGLTASPGIKTEEDVKTAPQDDDPFTMKDLDATASPRVKVEEEDDKQTAIQNIAPTPRTPFDKAIEQVAGMAVTDGLSDAKVLDAIKVLREAMDAIEQSIANKQGYENEPRGAAASSALRSLTATTQIPAPDPVAVKESGAVNLPVTPSRGTAGVNSSKRRARSPSPGAEGLVENKKRSPMKQGGEMRTPTPPVDNGADNGAEEPRTNMPAAAATEENGAEGEAPTEGNGTGEGNAPPQGNAPTEPRLAEEDFWARANIRW